jgi:glutamyl-Q tRNA(Asp) synthetase
VTIVSRFAPSPTGRLHLGHAFSAVLAHDLARAAGGAFLLRIEDIDPTRSRPEFAAAIEEDLHWLGLAWDGAVVRQSDRMALYRGALDRLKAQGLIYPCFCTRAEIAASAAAPHGDEGPVYPGTCRPPGETAQGRRKDEPHCWRLDMARALDRVGTQLWHDAKAGWISAKPGQGDVVLARKETPTSYHLAVTIDDAAQGVTDVVRGMDLFQATHVHRVLQALLGLPTPRYHHHPLLTGADGKRLAKRNGARGLGELRMEGADPKRVLAALRAGDPSLASGVGAPTSGACKPSSSS